MSKIFDLFVQVLLITAYLFFLNNEVNLFHLSLAFHIETSHLICSRISYRNQLLDLQSKSNYWFLYEMQHWAEMG